MGSLLKEYLTLSHKQEDILELAEDDNSIKSSEAMLDSAEGPLEPEESSGLEQLNCDRESESLENGNIEDESEYKSRSTSDNGATTIKQFKNIVAIVDPPRVGLHPTVSHAVLL